MLHCDFLIPTFNFVFFVNDEAGESLWEKSSVNMFSIGIKTDIMNCGGQCDVPESADLGFFKFTSFEQKVGSFPIMKRSPYWMVFEVGPTKNEGQTGHSQIESHLPSQRP